MTFNVLSLSQKWKNKASLYVEDGSLPTTYPLKAYHAI